MADAMLAAKPACRAEAINKNYEMTTGKPAEGLLPRPTRAAPLQLGFAARTGGSIKMKDLITCHGPLRRTEDTRTPQIWNRNGWHQNHCRKHHWHQQDWKHD